MLHLLGLTDLKLECTLIENTINYLASGRYIYIYIYIFYIFLLVPVSSIKLRERILIIIKTIHAKNSKILHIF